MSWTTPDDIAEQIRRLWTDGRILAERVSPSGLFPLSLRLRRPTVRELSDRFDDTRSWIKTLEISAKAQRGWGYDVSWEEINNRALGRNRIPASISVATASDALALIGAQQQAEQFDLLLSMTTSAQPKLLPWLTRRPFTALDHFADWERILSVVAWFVTNPHSGLYLRQIDVPGVDSKFIETRKGVLIELLDIALPPEAVNAVAIGARAFSARYGLKDKPTLVRLRILDNHQSIAGLTDLTLPIEQISSVELGSGKIIVTENEVNGLALPPVRDAAVFFGLGYAIELLSRITWLGHRRLYYWGDIDTHGFAMLDRFRANFPSAISFLMDRGTLLSHETHWSEESMPTRTALERLTANERAVFDDLRFDRLGPRVRLEQERIGFGAIQRALALIEAGSDLSG